MELHVIGEKGKEEVILLNENMEIVKPVYDYLKFQKQLGRAINSIRAYGTDLKIYFRYLEMGGLLYEQITPSDILKFIEYLREFDGLKVLHKESSRSAKTINRITGTVYHFYKFCEMTKAIENPVPMRDMNNSFSQYRGLMYHARKDNMTKKSVFKLKEKKHRVKILTQDEAEYFCNNLNRIRDRLIFKVMYLTGARIQETLDLQIKMIPIPDTSKKVAVFSQIKSKGKYRDLYVPMSLVEELDNFILNDRCRVETDHDFIFISQQKQNFGKHMTYRGVYEVFKTVQKKIGLYFNFHDLRHTFGSSLVTDGIDISIIRILMGHEHISTTQQYLHLSGKFIEDSLAVYWEQSILRGGEENERK